MRRAACLLLAAAAVACSPSANKQYLAPYVPPNRVVDLNNETFDPKADILFVIDNSSSMDVHQQNLADNIDSFTSVFLKKSVLNYNISVISTDTNTHFPCCGKFFGDTRVVNKFTPNADTVLKRNLLLGVGGDGYEKMFDPIFLALTDPLLTTWNAGFLRDDAALIVIFITDAEDQSVVQPDPNHLYDFLLGLKNGDKRKVLSFGAIVPSNVSDCRRDPSNNPGQPDPTPQRIEAFLSRTQPNRSNILNLCAKDFGQRLAQFATDIVTQVSSVIYLTRAPVLSSVRVTYGTAELPMDPDKGWSFDPEKNAIHLGTQIDWTSQPVGSQVKVVYNAARFDEEHK